MNEIIIKSFCKNASRKGTDIAGTTTQSVAPVVGTDIATAPVITHAGVWGNYAIVS